MFDWLFGKSRTVSDNSDFPRVMIWGGDDPDEWYSFFLHSDGWHIPIGVKYIVFDLRGIGALGEYGSLFTNNALNVASNSAVISDNGVNVQSHDIVFVHDDKRGDSGQTETVISIRGNDPDGTMVRVAQMMAINQTTIHGISSVRGGQMLNVVASYINGADSLRAPEGEKAYLYDTQVSDDWKITGYAVYVDKDTNIPASALEMFKAIGENNAK